jgi:hypothetical protein
MLALGGHRPTLPGRTKTHGSVSRALIPVLSQYFPVLRAPTAANYQGAPDALNICRTGSTKSIRPPGVYHCGRKTRQRSGIRLHGVTMPTRSLPILFFIAVNCQAVRDW